nr:hypothetical protein [Tanacetum cinerariifolium]
MEPSKPFKSCLKKVSNIDGNIVGKDGKPIKVMRNVHIGTMVTSGVSSGSSATHIQMAEKLVTSSHDEQQHHATCDNATNDQGLHGATDGIMKDNVNGTKQSFAAIFKAPTAAKVVRLTKMKNNEAVQGANVAIPLHAVEEIRNRFQNTLYGYFIGKRLAFPLVENYVKNAWAKFGLERSMLVNGFFFFQFATKEDAYKSTMCQKSWGRNTYARALVEVSPETDQKDSLLVAIPFPNGKGHSLETTKASADVDENDGFTQVTRKGGKGKQEGKGKQVAGIRLSKPKPNMVYQVVHKPPNNNDGTSSSTKNDDVQPPKPPAIPFNEGTNLVTLRNSFDTLMERAKDEEVKEVFNEEESWKSKDNIKARTPFNKNLLTHEHYMRNRPWCLLGDFNVSLFVDEKSTSSSFIDTSMCDFQDYVDVIEMSDVNSTGLRFTWNQKPKGDNGVLKKTDRIMANIKFYTSFVGSSAIFQPYRISDHFLAVLRVLMISHIKPCPFKFSNILIALDKDLDNIDLRKEAAYLLASNDASLLEEKFVMQKAKVEWLKSADSKLDYFHKVVKSQATRNQIDSITTTHGINVDRDQDALFAMGKNRSPRPDGHTTAFFKEAWEIISTDVIKAIKEFFNNGVLLKKLNHTILALILKAIKVMRNVHIGTMVTSGVSSGSSATHIQTAEKLVTSSRDEHQHHATCDNATNDQGLHGATDGIMKDNANGTKQSFAAIFKAPTTAKVVRLTEMKNKEVVQGANVAIHLPAVKEINNRRPIMLDAYTSTMCQKSWGRNTYARALVEVSSETDQKDSLVVAILFPNRKGHSLETKFKVVETKSPANVDENNGFTQVTRKRGKGKQEGKGKQVAGIRLSKPKPNMVYQVVHKPPNNNDGTSSSTKNDDVQPPKPPTISSNKGTNLVTLRNSFDTLMERAKNLLTHKHYMRNRSWCLLGDFNVSLFVDEKSTGSSFIDTDMRDFQDYVDAIEMSDVNSTRLRFTWNQKPKGDNGVLKKTDRIMANIEFYTSFLVAFRVVKRLKFLKCPLCKLLYHHGNLHANVKKLRHELDTVQIALDKDSDNIDLREEAAYLLAFNDASLLEEKFLMQKAKVEWLKSGDSKLDYFHKVVKSQATRNQIDSITTTHGINVDRDQEIRDALFAMGENRSPRPDGYTAAFFKEAWEIISTDVIKAIKEFFNDE